MSVARLRAEPLAGLRLQRLAAAWWIPASLVLAFVTWPFASVGASPGLDHSWQIALHLVAQDGLSFGHDAVFTYGPLGFLLEPVLLPGWTGTASVIVTFAAEAALCALLLRGALRSLPAPLAIAVVYAFLGALAGLGFALFVADYLGFFVLFLAVWMLERAEPPPAVFVVVGAVAAACQLFVKLNGGLLCILVLALAAWRCRPGGVRSLALLGVSYVGAVAALWLATGNSIGDLPRWFRLSAHVVLAYTGAMASDAPGRTREYVLAGVVLVGAAAAVFLRVRMLDRWRALSLAGIGLLYGFGWWKEGFVRHDVHALAFFAAIAIGLVAFRWRGAAGLVAGLTTALALTAIVIAPEFASGLPFHPLRAGGAAAAALGDSVVPHRRRHEIAAGRALIEARVGLGPDVLSELRGRSVDVGPYETSAAWGYALRWRPQLVLQQYTAEDATLDSANANALASRGPARLLRQELWPALDGKHPLYEAPASFLVIVCRYRELSSNGSWAVFARGTDRCGPPRLLDSTSARGGTAVSVPAAPTPRDLVFARIRIGESFVDRLAQFLIKDPMKPALVVDGERYRLVRATADGPLILRMPRDAGLAAPVGGAVDYSRISVADVPSYRIEFYAVALTGAWHRPTLPGGTLAGESVTYGPHRARLVAKAVDGRVEGVLTAGGAVTITGWAGNVRAGAPADDVLVYSHDGRLLGAAHPSSARFDVAGVFKDSRLLPSGYSVSVAAADLRGGGGFTVVAVSGRSASIIGRR